MLLLLGSSGCPVGPHFQLHPRCPTTLEETEHEHVRRALQESNWRVGGPEGAARKFGLKRTTLQAKIAKLGIEGPVAR